MLKKVTVFKFKFKVFALTLVALFLIGTLFSYLSAAVTTMSEQPTFWAIAFEAISYTSFALLALLLLSRLWTLLVKVGKAVGSLLETEEVNLTDDDIIEEAPQVEAAVQGLAEVLDQLEQDSSNASLLLVEAEKYAARLVALTKTIVLKADSMRTEAGHLESAIEAITGRDSLQIARSAGKVRDTHIRELMLCDTLASDYWLSVSRLIATQLGTLEQWSTGYDKFASNLIGEVSGAKGKLAAISASLDLVGTARPLLKLQQNLNEAEAYLQPQKQPRLAYAFKALPSVSAGSHNLNQALAIDDALFRDLE